MRKINYDKLFLILKARDIKGTELIQKRIVSAPTLIKLKNGKNVNTDVLIRLCDYLCCSLTDICEYTPVVLPSNSDELDPDIPFI